jgi:hypothetical protein
MPSYIPYTRDTPLTLNALTLTEGFDSNAAVTQVATIKTSIGSFETGRNQAILNSVDISTILDKNGKLQNNPKYKKYIPMNGKTRPSAADEIIRDTTLLNDANNQVYILGSIAVASLVVLSLYM